MPDSIDTDNSGTQQKEQLLQWISEIAKHYEKAQQFRQKLQAVSRDSKSKQHRKLRYSFARSVVRLSQIYRQIQFTPQFQRKIIDLIRQAAEEYKAAEREIAKIQRKLEESVLAGSARLPRTPYILAATDAAASEAGKGLGMGRHGTPAYLSDDRAR